MFYFLESFTKQRDPSSEKKIVISKNFLVKMCTSNVIYGLVDLTVLRCIEPSGSSILHFVGNAVFLKRTKKQPNPSKVLFTPINMIYVCANVFFLQMFSLNRF